VVCCRAYRRVFVGRGLGAFGRRWAQISLFGAAAGCWRLRYPYAVDAGVGVVGVVRFIPWLGSLIVRDSPAARWLVVAGLGLALAVLVAAVVRLWPMSRRWTGMNRLHRVASRNEAGLRAAARCELDAALRVLAAARRDCLRHDHHDDAARIGRLLRRIEVARDQIASAYLPSPANAPGQRRDLDLATLQASEAVMACCSAIAGQAGEGTSLPPAMVAAADRAVRGLTDGGLVVR
jgi:hypothetical protein